jgi:hypothetical protein
MGVYLNECGLGCDMRPYNVTDRRSCTTHTQHVRAQCARKDKSITTTKSAKARDVGCTTVLSSSFVFRIGALFASGVTGAMSQSDTRYCVVLGFLAVLVPPYA